MEIFFHLFKKYVIRIICVPDTQQYKIELPYLKEGESKQYLH